MSATFRLGVPFSHGFLITPFPALPGYAILSLILGVCVICMAIASILGYRHYKLEAEINSMTWKVHANEVLSCNPSHGHRGSMHLMAKRGSQAVSRRAEAPRSNL